MEEIKHRSATFIYALVAAVIVLQLIQWGLHLFDWHIAYPWNRVAVVVMTILLWAPWRKLHLPKNQDNNDLFPGQ